MIAEREARPIRLTASGTAISRDTRLAAISAKPGAFDLIVRLQNNKTRADVWEIEADNAAGSHFETFDPPLRFRDGIYVEMASADLAQCRVNLSVVEPVPTP